MSIHGISVRTIDGETVDLGAFAGKALLVVNVASRCGLTPQYEGLQRLCEQYAGKDFDVLGFPCNQFAGQEPGTHEEIKSFCSLNYNVTFPLFAKVDVNGDERHPLYEALTRTPDGEGRAGDIAWNFEKFLVSPDGEVVARFRPLVEPEAPELVEAIKAQLGG